MPIPSEPILKSSQAPTPQTSIARQPSFSGLRTPKPCFTSRLGRVSVPARKCARVGWGSSCPGSRRPAPRTPRPAPGEEQRPAESAPSAPKPTGFRLPTAGPALAAEEARSSLPAARPLGGLGESRAAGESGSGAPAGGALLRLHTRPLRPGLLSPPSGDWSGC